LLDEGTGAPVLAAARNLPRGLADRPAQMSGRCYCLDSFQSGDLEGAANVNIVICSRLKWLAGRGTDGLRCHASIPLYANGRRLGVMNVASAAWRRLSDDDLGLLHTVGDMLAVAVDRSRLYAKSVAAGALAERNRVARELHDTLAQGIAATAMQLDTAEALLDAGADAARVRKPVSEALRLTRGSLDEARRSVFALRAPEDEETDLPAALARLIEELAGGIDPSITLTTSGLERTMSPGLVGELARIARSRRQRRPACAGDGDLGGLCGDDAAHRLDHRRRRHRVRSCGRASRALRPDRAGGTDATPGRRAGH
jgi:GAF domain-containing protein